MGNQQGSHRFWKLCRYYLCQCLRPNEAKKESVIAFVLAIKGFRGKRINALGKISLPISFGGQENARIEYLTLDVVDLYFHYNAIFGRGFPNKFNAVIHIGYLCIKMLALHGTITIHSSQKEARNIERAIYKS